MRTFRDLTAAQGSLIGSLLRDKKARDAERALVLEGVKPIREALASRLPLLRMLVVTPEFLERGQGPVRVLLDAHARSVFVCRGRTLQKLADVATPAGILAVLEQPEWDLATILGRARLMILYGEDLQDPANVGAIIRTAAAFSFDAVALSRESADIFNPKVVRATAGQILHLPVLRFESPAPLLERGCELLAAEPEGPGSRPITALTSAPRRAVLAFGNESRGLSPATLRLATARFHIPTTPGVESLNVAASAAIAMFYFRHLAKRG